MPDPRPEISAPDVSPAEVVGFWVDEVGADGWYARSTSLDQTIRDRFRPAWEAAATLAELSDELGISRERVRQVQREAERMLASGEFGAVLRGAA